MKKNTIYTLIFLLSIMIVDVQTTYAQNDPQAKSILDKIKKDYDSYKSMSMAFTLTLELPGEPVQVQDGYVLQQADKYRLTMDEQAMYCDGKTLWVHLISNNEVQINNAESGEESEFMSPKDLLKVYENGDYEYAIAAEEMMNGEKVTQIEFKPLSQNSEYSKMRLSVSKTGNKIKSLKIFSRDGSRYTLEIKKIEPNKSISDSDFVFDASKYEGIYVEDLRID